MNETPTHLASDDPAAPSGPVFVSGRQHSGNTLVAVILGRATGCWAHTNENVFFERRGLIDKLETVEKRTERVIPELRIADADQAAHDATAAHLRAWAPSNPNADALAIFLEGMRFVTAHTGNTFWVQKATSYIFYAEEILEAVPGSKFVMLMRNVYDISASRKKRSLQVSRFTDHFFTTTLSWNKGFRIARDLLERYPDRFICARYEDLVTSPEETVSRLFGFLDVPFDEAYLDVPHINKSEKQFTKEDVAAVSRDSLKSEGPAGEKRGINASRLYYYSERLAPSEVAQIDFLVDGSLVREYYPELPHTVGKHPIGVKVRALGALSLTPVRIFNTLMRTRKMRGFSVGWIMARVMHRFGLGRSKPKRPRG